MSASRQEKVNVLLELARMRSPMVNVVEVARRLHELRNGITFDSEGDSVSACIDKALNQAQLAIDEYYNGDRQWAERWLLTAFDANQKASNHGK